MSRGVSPFSARTILAVLAVGAAAFLLFLYAIGAGWDGRSDRNGGAHAAANGLNGFAGLVRLLEAQGHEVALSRNEAGLDDEALLVLTPEADADGERIAEVIAARRHRGPTLLILPKWLALPVDQLRGLEAPRGWVVLGGASEPEWINAINGLDGTGATVAARKEWRGLGLRGALPRPKQVLTLQTDTLIPLVVDEHGGRLVGYTPDAVPVSRSAAKQAGMVNKRLERRLWPVIVVAEPDLMNNYGLADQARARLAVALVDRALTGSDRPIVFDLTLAGLGRGENLLTLAFAPPFLAATLSLLMAALVVAWRGFFRFGPPVAEPPALAKGKRQLARNGAALVERARRLHLLGPPYAALVATRIGEALGVRSADPHARDTAIAKVLASRGLAEDYVAQAEALRSARHSAELLRAAGTLRTIERTLTR